MRPILHAPMDEPAIAIAAFDIAEFRIDPKEDAGVAERRRYFSRAVANDLHSVDSDGFGRWDR